MSFEQLNPSHKIQSSELTVAHLQELQNKTKYSTEELKEIFTSGEFGKKETLSKDDFAATLNKLYKIDKIADQTLIERLFELFDLDKNGVIDFTEFSSALSILNKGSVDEKLSFIFQTFDLNGDGEIIRQEFQSIVKSLWNEFVSVKTSNPTISFSPLALFLRLADLDHDGVISLQEFQAVAPKYAHKVVDHKLKILEHQTGGHIGNFFKIEDNKIMKLGVPLELWFYSNVSVKFSFLQPYVPKYYGIQQKDGMKYIVMEDLTSKFKRPSVMDIKMGTSSVGEDAPPEKRKLMSEKDMKSTTRTLGMRITGIKVYRKTSGNYDRFNKSWGRKVTPETMHDSLYQYFFDGKELRFKILQIFKEKVHELHQLLKANPALRIYSSSLLFMYDGESDDAGFSLKMIDFAHVHEIKDHGGKDEGYLFGLENLSKFLHIIEKSSSRQN